MPNQAPEAHHRSNVSTDTDSSSFTIHHSAFLPALPIPFRRDGTIHAVAQEAYVRYMQRQPVGGVAVWAHTGRGLLISPALRAEVLAQWRGALPEKTIVAGVGGSPEATTTDDCLRTAEAMADAAARGGADALLVYAPTIARTLAPNERDRFIVEYHTRLAAYGVPLLLFYLYEAAGGVGYSPAVIEELVSREDVIGMKIATADSVMTYQDIARLFREKFPNKLIVTGEDRFFGYSLMIGADAALVGMGSALTGLQTAMMNAYFREAEGVPMPVHPETERFAGKSFLELSALVDAFAHATFAQPLQGYILRMLWVLVELGVIPEDAANDPWGPALTDRDREVVRTVVRELREQ